MSERYSSPCEDCWGEGSCGFSGAPCIYCDGKGWIDEGPVNGCPGCWDPNCCGECYEEQAEFYSQQETDHA